MAKGGRKKAKPAGRPPVRPTDPLPTVTVIAPQRTVETAVRTSARIEIAIGAAVMLGAAILANKLDGAALSIGGFLAVITGWALGSLGIAHGASRLDRRAGELPRDDRRRWIYGSLAALFAVIYALLMWKVIPSRLPSAMLHLATIPLFTLVMAVGTLIGGRFGWWLAVVGGSLVLLSMIVLIARILASAAFLAGVYGAFGKAASTFALVSVALIVELVGILPICQVKFLMSRPGRRTYGV